MNKNPALDFLRRNLRYARMTDQPGPFIIEGKPYHHVRRAAQIIGMIAESTVWRWADTGHTPFGLDLDVVRQPLLRTGHEKPRSNRQFRLLISDASVQELKTILHDHPIRPGPLSDGSLYELQCAANLYRKPSIA